MYILYMFVCKVTDTPTPTLAHSHRWGSPDTMASPVCGRGKSWVTLNPRTVRCNPRSRDKFHCETATAECILVTSEVLCSNYQLWLNVKAALDEIPPDPCGRFRAFGRFRRSPKKPIKPFISLDFVGMYTILALRVNLLTFYRQFLGWLHFKYTED